MVRKNFVSAVWHVVRGLAWCGLIFLAAPSVGHSAPSGWLGLSYKTNSQGQLEVAGVFPQSGAMLAGLQSGDILVNLDGVALSSPAELRRRAGALREGQKVHLTVQRAGAPVQLTVVLGPRPDDLRAFTGSSVGSRAGALGEHFYGNSQRVKLKPAVTILDFWATWCGPCRKTLPILADLYLEYGNDGLEIVGISSESIEVLQRFQQTHPQPYPLYQDVHAGQADRYGIRAIPTLMVLDSNGYIHRVITGAPDRATLQAAIVPLLRASKGKK